MLTLIGTPIGNLDDLSSRAARALMAADIILAEDTRSVQTLLKRARQMALRHTARCHTELVEVSSDCMDSSDDPLPQNDKVNKESQKIISYYKEVEFEKLSEVIDWLEQGLHVALVSEAGMPVISDPGHLLVQTAQKRNIPLTVIPGPSSVHTALVASGIKFDQYQFVGFLPKKDVERTKLFEKLRETQELLGKIKLVFVAFESPERVQNTLAHLYQTYPTINMVLCRELTKKFEEVVHQPSATEHYRGEIVLVCDFGKK